MDISLALYILDNLVHFSQYTLSSYHVLVIELCMQMKNKAISAHKEFTSYWRVEVGMGINTYTDKSIQNRLFLW